MKKLRQGLSYRIQISHTSLSYFQGEAGFPGPRGLPGLRGEKGDRVSDFEPQIDLFCGCLASGGLTLSVPR